MQYLLAQNYADMAAALEIQSAEAGFLVGSV